MAQRGYCGSLNTAKTFCLVVILFVIAGCSSNTVQSPRADKGVLNLSSWDFERDGSVKLFGEWGFSWQNSDNSTAVSAIESQDIRDYYHIPGVWQGKTTQGVPLASQGYATYHLRVQLSENAPGSLSLLVSGGMSVWQILINDKKEASSGILGRSRNSEIPQRHFVVAHAFSSKPYLDIVLRVSNFHNLQGGINGEMRLGTARQIDDFYTLPRILGAFMGGALLCISLVYLVLFGVRRQSRENLYFGLFCLAWCVAILFSPSGGFLMTTLVPALPWEWYITLSMLPYGLTIPLMLMFYHSLSPKRYGVIVQGVYWVLGVLYMGYILLTPANAYDPVLLKYYFLTSTAFIYIFACFFIDLVRGKRGMILLSVGYLALGLAEFNDILFDLNIVSTVDFRPVGVFVVILSYAFFLAARFSLAFTRSETLSEELRERNAQLVHYNKLKRELVLRQKTERDLRGMQSRLSTILDSLDDALIAVNQSREIAFCNQPFEMLTGHKVDGLLGQPFMGLLKETDASQSKALLEYESREQSGVFDPISFGKEDGSICTVSLVVTNIEIEDEPLQLMVVRPAGAQEKGSASFVSAAMLQELDANRQRILKLEEAMLSLETGDYEGQQEIKDDLKALDDLLDHFGKRVAVTEKNGDKRQVAVKVMQLAVECWKDATGRPKADMAELSGIWNVYMEKDGYYRTQTLDKYLAEETLPLKPRWKKVHATAQFVIANCDVESSLLQELQDAFRELKAL